MSFSLVYIAQRFCYRVWMFVYDWYVGGFRVIGGTLVRVLESLDRTWALRITLRNLFKPLYQDQSFLGRVLGIIFRTGRLILGGILYAILSILCLIIYVGWALVPAYIVYKGFFAA